MHTLTSVSFFFYRNIGNLNLNSILSFSMSDLFVKCDNPIIDSHVRKYGKGDYFDEYVTLNYWVYYINTLGKCLAM